LKTIIQITIAALIVNACVQAAISSWDHYQFADAIEQEARFGSQKTTSELHRRVLDISESYGVPLAYNDVSVTRRSTQTEVNFSYVKNVELLPRLYMREFTYEVNVSVHPVRPITADDIIK
jgi:hypothetical protein